MARSPSEYRHMVNPSKTITMRKLIIHGCEARGDGRDPYLTRWIIFKFRLIALYFHQFHRSDAEDLHDHPWNFISIILWRGYYEQTFTSGGLLKIKRVYPGTILYRKSSHAHRVILIDRKPAYTLVVRFKDKLNWGFYQRGTYINFIKYFKKMGC
jgi:hypothetical protein